MSVIIANVDLGLIEELRSIAVVLFVIATVGVWAGVWLEGDRFSLATHKIGWKLLVWSLGAETLLTIFIFAADAEIGVRQRTEIISLQKRLLPRTLSPEAQDRIAAKVCPFGPQPSNLLVIAPIDLFIGQLDGITRRCNWVPNGIPDRDATIAVIANFVGVVFLYDPAQPGQAEASKAFSSALVSEGVAADARAIPTGAKLAPIIHVVISIKP